MRGGENKEGHNRRGVKRSKGWIMDSKGQEKVYKGKEGPGTRMKGWQDKLKDERGVRHHRRWKKTDK